MPKLAHTSVLLSRKHYKILQEASNKSGISISDLLHEALSDYTENVLPTTVEAAIRMSRPILVAV